MKEVNFDGLSGLTHNYAGLSFGNTASLASKGITSSPKAAALQTLNKMWYIHQLGVTQAFLPPHPRPYRKFLDDIGLDVNGKDRFIKNSAFSSAFMWTANAGTMSPSVDNVDGKLHITPANLISNLHRSIEADQTYKIFKQIFGDIATVHNPLPKHAIFSDEGAANHMRISSSHNIEGLNIFVYGRDTESLVRPEKFPARQTKQAFEAVARNHHIKNVLHIQQNPNAIDKGVFHNDVTAVANENVILYHEEAFLTPLRESIKQLYDDYDNIHFIRITQEELSLELAVRTYFFNSQIITTNQGEMEIIAPIEAKNNEVTRKLFEKIIADNNPIKKVHYLDVTQSMRNGGGPACLRFKILLNNSDIELIKSKYNVFLNENLYNILKDWINEFYPDKLVSEMLNNDLLELNNKALKELENITKIKIL